MNRICDFFKVVSAYTMTVTTLIFTFVPESSFSHGFITVNFEPELIILCNRVLTFLSVFLLTSIVSLLYYSFRKKIYVGNDRYKVVVEYSDLFEKTDCKKVISFDECFTTQVGGAPSEIKPQSVCGQFLSKEPNININELITKTGLRPQRKHSEYQSKESYESGRLLPFDNYLLLAFAKLDANGLGRLTREEFVKCLDVLWEEIDKYYACQSIAIPILGSGITRFSDENLTQQQLLDIMIASYKISPHKLKYPAKLHIVCRRSENFSLNKVGEYI